MATNESHFDLVIHKIKQKEIHFDLNRVQSYSKKAHFDFIKNSPIQNENYCSLSINISSSTLSDTFDLETPTPIKLGDCIKGKILDKDYDFQVTEISKQYGSKVSKCIGSYKPNRLLYTRFSLNYAPARYQYIDRKGKKHAVKYATSKQLAGVLARKLGLKLVYKAIDFIPSQCVYHVDKEDEEKAYILEGTYQSILSQLFGWVGSKLPNLAINVFIDNDTLYIIQRGEEEKKHTINKKNVVDAPHITWKNVHTLWGGVGSNIIKANTEEPEPFTGSIKFGDAENVYKNGYLQEERHDKSTTYFVYGAVDDSEELYLLKRVIFEIVSDFDYNGNFEYEGRVTRTEYHYTKTDTEIYLDSEKEITGGEFERTVTGVTDAGKISETIENIERYTDWDEAEIYITRYSPIGNGWYGISKSQVTNEGEETVSTALTQGAPGQRASQYTINKTNEALNNKGIYHDLYVLARLLLHGYTFYDSTLPIAIVNNRLGLNQAAAVSKAINELNNKTEERVSLQVLGVNHVYDCNDSISFGNHEYHLESNIVTHTPAGITQNLTLVRWY